jgi:hypothetical protein
VLGRFTQNLPNNRKLYAENNKDIPITPRILHLFLYDIKLNRAHAGWRH